MLSVANSPPRYRRHRRRPLNVPPAGLLPIVSVTPPVNPVATLPKASYAVTSTAA